MASAKKGKKSKGVTLSFQEFSATVGGDAAPAGGNVVYAPKKKESFSAVMSSWADEVEEDEMITAKERIVLPTAPRASRGPAYEDSQIPKVAPFQANIGNLHYDIDESDIYQFFKDLDILELKLPKDHVTGRLKGFGFVEFSTREDLVEALIMNEGVLRGRPVRVGLLDSTQRVGDRRGGDRMGGDRMGGMGRPPPEDEGVDDWRSMAGAVVGGGFGGDNRRGGGGGFDRGGDRFGGDSRGGFDRESEDFVRGPTTRRDRDTGEGPRGSSYFERGPPPQSSSYGGGRRDRSDFPQEEEEGESTWRRPGPPPQQQQMMQRDYYNRGPPDDRDHREGRRPHRREEEEEEDFVRGPPVSREPRDRDPRSEDDDFVRPQVLPREEKKERKKLVLQPRTATTTKTDGGEASRSSIFGEAKPVDTLKRELEIEEKQKQEREEKAALKKKQLEEEEAAKIKKEREIIEQEGAMEEKQVVRLLTRDGSERKILEYHTAPQKTSTEDHLSWRKKSTSSITSSTGSIGSSSRHRDRGHTHPHRTDSSSEHHHGDLHSDPEDDRDMKMEMMQMQRQDGGGRRGAPQQQMRGEMRGRRQDYPAPGGNRDHHRGDRDNRSGPPPPDHSNRGDRFAADRGTRGNNNMGDFRRNDGPRQRGGGPSSGGPPPRMQQQRTTRNFERPNSRVVQEDEDGFIITSKSTSATAKNRLTTDPSQPALTVATPLSSGGDTPPLAEKIIQNKFAALEIGDDSEED